MDRLRKSRRGGVRFVDPFPKYLQIREILARRIARAMRIGDRLPTEHELRTEFAVSRETVRDALAGLEADGIIVRSPGQGTFVAELPSATAEARFTGLSEDFSRFRLDTAAVVLFTGEVAPDAPVGQSLALAAGEKVLRIYRRRQIDGQPFSLHEAFLPVPVGQRVVAFDLQTTSIVDVLSRRLQLPIREHLQTIEAVAADVESASHLGTGIGAPLLQIARHFKLENGDPVVYFRALYRSDRYYYTVALGQRSAAEDDLALPATPPSRASAARKQRPAAKNVKPAYPKSGAVGARVSKPRRAGR